MSDHSTHDASAHGHGDTGHHVVPVRVYLIIFSALLIGTYVTVLVSKYDLDVTILGKVVPLNTVVALVIAAIKATLVVLYFMHIKYGPRLNWIFAAAGFMWMAILLILTLADVASRNW